MAGFEIKQPITDSVGEISAASREQSAGVSQVGEALMQMDQATEQNTIQGRGEAERFHFHSCRRLTGGR